MRTIHKFAATANDTARVMMPKGALVRHVGVQNRGSGNLLFWAEVDTSLEREERTFFVRGTGHPVPDGNVEFVATVIDGPFVWHVWQPKRPVLR